MSTTTTKYCAVVIDAVGYRAPSFSASSLIGEADRFCEDLSGVVNDAVNKTNAFYSADRENVIRWKFVSKFGQEARFIVYLDGNYTWDFALDVLTQVVSLIQFNALTQKRIVTCGTITYGTFGNLAKAIVDTALPRVTVEKHFAAPVFYESLVKRGFLSEDEDGKTYIPYVNLNKDYDIKLVNYKKSIHDIVDNRDNGYVDEEKTTGLQEKLDWLEKESR